MKADQDVVWCPVEGELVLFHSTKGLYFGLNNTGAEIWRMLSDGAAIPAIVNELQTKYNVDEATAINEVNRLTRELTDAGLIICD
ncbi:MAG TPA: PqqD family protein [Blastocatellia bacterium]|nr:PqqD family protein [Blastocatellia bacterium]